MTGNRHAPPTRLTRWRQHPLFMIPLLLAIMLGGCGGTQNTLVENASPQPPHQENGDHLKDQDAIFNYILGHLYIRDNQPDLAAKAFERVAAADEKQDEVRMHLAHFALQKGDLKETTRLAREVIAINGDHFGARTLLAGILASTGQEKEAAPHYERLLAQAPGHVQIRLLLARLYGQMGEMDKANKVIAPLYKNKHLAWRARLTMARVHESRKEYPQALRALHKARALAPRELDPVLLMGSILQAQGKLSESEQLYRDFLLKNPDNAAIQNRLGRVLINRNNLSEALAIFRNIAAKSPDRTEERMTAAIILLNEERFDEAMKELRLAEAIDPDNPAVHYYLGQTFSAMEQYGEALKSYDRIKPDQGFYRDAQANMAVIEANSEQIDAAIERISRLITQFPQQAELYQTKTSLLLQKERHEEAFQAASAGIAVNPGLIRLYYSRAVALDKLGRWPEAEKDLQVVVKAEPNNPSALNYLAYSWTERNQNLELAYKMLRKAVKLAPNDGFITDSLGWVLFRLNRLEESLRVMRQAVLFEPKDPTINDHLGDVLFTMGRIPEAVAAWRKSLELDPNNEKVKEKIEKNGR